MKLTDKIRNIFTRGKNLVVKDPYQTSSWNWLTTNLEFGNVIFNNVMEILTDLVNDVELSRVNKNTDVFEFANFKTFFEQDGKDVLNRYFVNGYVVIKLPDEDNSSYRILLQNFFE